MTEVRAAALCAGYGRQEVLHEVDLDVHSGGLTGLLGPSGCGKSTLVRVIAGFHRPTAGTVQIGDRTVDGPGVRVRPEKRRVGIVPQDVALFPNLDVAGNVGYGVRRWGRIDRQRVAAMLDMVGLPDAGALRVHQLSGGMQQRVAVARALAPQPDVILLDEPFGALDPSLRAAVRSDVRAALRSSGTTAVLVTHDQEEALSLCDRVAVMRDGRIVHEGTPGDVYRRPASLWAARFVGDLVELPVVHDTADTGRVSTALGELTVEGVVVERGEGPSDAAVHGDRAVATLRPEQIHLDPAGVGARVGAVTYFGHDALIDLRLEDPAGPAAQAQAVKWRISGQAPPAVGDLVRVAVAGPSRVFRGV